MKFPLRHWLASHRSLLLLSTISIWFDSTWVMLLYLFDCFYFFIFWIYRALFLAIFKHLVCIGQRGCYRTALEFCKVLYTLDMDTDPLAVVLMIDFYAIKAQEFAWFIDFFSCYEPTKNLSQLPNMAYAIALAHFYHSKTDPSSLERADEYLKKALLMFPNVLIPMLEKCSIQADHRVKTHSYFSPITAPKYATAMLFHFLLFRSLSLFTHPDFVCLLDSTGIRLGFDWDSTGIRSGFFRRFFLCLWSLGSFKTHDRILPITPCV